MARGRLLRSKVKEARAVSKATESARLKAVQDAEKKKPLEVSIREHLGKIIDRVDPVELLAVAGVAIVLANVPEFIEQTKKSRGFVELSLEFWGVTGGVETAASLLGIKGKVDTLEEWLIVFAVSYLIVHNFGLLVQTTGNIAKSFSLLGLALLG